MTPPPTTAPPVRPRKSLPQRIRSWIRRRLLGRPDPIPPPPPPPPSTGFGIEQLHDAELERDDDPGYRLNLVVPTLETARVFGGIRTAMDLFEAVAGNAAEQRVVAATAPAAPRAPAMATTDATAGTDAVPKEATAATDPGAEPAADPATETLAYELVTLGAPDAALSVRPNDVFIATFWTTAELVMRIRRWQADTYGAAPGRFGYVVQDYEPGFYPYSVASELARATYDDPGATVAVYNTSLLRDWFHGLDIRFGAEHVFEPRILPELLAARAQPAVPRSRTILVYGRPRTPRNAFSSIVDGLRAWRAANPERASTWTVESLGQEHPVIDLGEGMVLRSAGKLSLEEYASRLREAAVGVSLMVSPHPSYPPLEMAHLGMLVVSNRFGPKDLAAWHPNVTSVADLRPATVAAAIDAACRRFEDDPESGDRAVAIETPFTSTEPQFPFAAELAAELEAGTNR